MLKKYSRFLFPLFLGSLICLFDSFQVRAQVRTQVRAIEQEDSTDLQSYDQLHKTINQELIRAETSLSCPGVKLAWSCGNGICEPNSNENEHTCPIDCPAAKVQSFDAGVVCPDVKAVFSPENEQEAAKIIRQAYLEGTHVRVIGSKHSFNSQLCTDGLVITTEKMNRILGLETFQGKEVVTVESGATVGQISEWLHQRGKTLGYALPGYVGLSVAGAIATGSHGNSLKRNPVLSSLVEAVSVIDGQGETHTHISGSKDPDLLRALRVNLGRFGMVTQVKLRVFPQFNLHMKMDSATEEKLFVGSGLADWIKPCDIAQLFWYPHSKKLIRICGQETQRQEDPGASSHLLDPTFPQAFVKPLVVALHLGSCFHGLNCLLEDLRYLSMKVQPPFKKLDRHGKSVSSGDLVGPSHRMISGNLSPYQKMLPANDWEIALPLSRLKSVLSYAADYFKNKQTCMPISGFAIRFAPAGDESLLAHTVALGEFPLNEPIALIEFLTYRPMGLDSDQHLESELFIQDFVGTLISQFGGRAHWGKNQDWVFRLQAKYHPYGENLNQFESLSNQFDPAGIFKTDFFKFSSPNATEWRPN